MYGLILIFVNIAASTVNVSQQVTVFPSEEACKAQLAWAVPYQQGKHDSDGYTVNGFCRPVVPVKTEGT